MTTSTAPAPASRAAVFGAVLAALWAAHDCADHVLQTDAEAAGKAPHADPCTLTHPGMSCTRASWVAMGGHVASYHALQVVLLAALRPLGVRPSWWRLVLAVVVSAGTHALLDRRWPVRWLLERTGSPRFAQLQAPINGPYVADQACHHGVLLIAAWIIAA